MSPEPLLVFDFDGVLVDGMPEYWWAARRAAQRLDPDLALPEGIPTAFASLRPHIHKGWEMVLVASELGQPDFDLGFFLTDYDAALSAALSRWAQEPVVLQDTLEAVRREGLDNDAAGWLALHRFYPGVEERLHELTSEGVPWLVLTTKGGAFATRLLDAADLKPQAVYGHERGSKPEVLLKLRDQGHPLWFVEDRRPTLERVRATPGLDSVRCFLALWGYLGPGDADGLEALGIQPLDATRFRSPLANWPLRRYSTPVLRATETLAAFWWHLFPRGRRMASNCRAAMRAGSGLTDPTDPDRHPQPGYGPSHGSTLIPPEFRHRSDQRSPAHLASDRISRSMCAVAACSITNPHHAFRSQGRPLLLTWLPRLRPPVFRFRGGRRT